MPFEIHMPMLSPTMQEGAIARWCKKEGDVVESGDVLCDIETDKATMEVEAVEEGTLAERLFADGTQGVAVCRQSGNPGASPGGRYRACRPHGVQLDVVRW